MDVTFKPVDFFLLHYREMIKKGKESKKGKRKKESLKNICNWMLLFKV